jgi:pyruvate,water dikinase
MIAALLLAATTASSGTPVAFDKDFTAIQPIVGVWEFVPAKDGPQLMVRGDQWTTAPEAGAAAKLASFFQGMPESILDEIKAYYYFPLALMKDATFAEGDLSVEIMPVSGKVDQAGGIAFGMTDPSSYWVLRINANEDNCMLFEYVKARRLARVNHKLALRSGVWRTLTASITGRHLTALVDGKPVFAYDLPRPVSGRFGLWSKADSVTRFRQFVVSPSIRSLK